MSLREQMKKQIEQEVKKFRKDVQKMEQSDNPYYSDPAVVKYETDQLKDALEAKVAEINADFNAKIDAEIEQAEREAARSTFRVMPSDRQLAEQFVTDLKAELTFAVTEGDKRAAIESFEGKLDHFETDGGLYEIKQRLPEVVQAVKDDDFAMTKLRKISRTFSELKTEEQARLDALQDDKLSGVDYNYRTLRMTHKAYQ